MSNAALSQATAAMHAFQGLHSLSLQALQLESLPALRFHILNSTSNLIRYDRAVLWDLQGFAPRALGISGQSAIEEHAPLVEEWKELVTAIPGRAEAVVLDGPPREDATVIWESVKSRTKGLQALWLPLHIHGELAAGLWLERWGNSPWTNEEKAVLTSLTQSYQGAWERLQPVLWRSRLARWLRFHKRSTAILIGLAVALLFLPVRLRVVAPCEVVPADPWIVSAPLSGTIESMEVQPGQQVEKGQILFRYDSRIPEEELRIVNEQVEIMQSRLARVHVEAFQNAAARSELQTLRHRLRQEQLRLRLAQSERGRLLVRAGLAGTVLLERPHQWKGRLVQLGDPVLMIADPQKTRIRLWIPESNNIAMDRRVPIQVLLNVRPTEGLQGRLDYISHQARPNADNLLSFAAEADWYGSAPDAQLGLRGTAILYGKRVSLAYWLLRRPLSALRQWFGL